MKDQSRIPTTDTDKDDLLRAGLSEKHIEFEDLDVDAYLYRERILEEYPKLRDAGGFMFFKCGTNSRSLVPLSHVVLSTPRVLKDRVGRALTYICPLQRDLDISAVFQLPEGVSTCIDHSLLIIL